MAEEISPEVRKVMREIFELLKSGPQLYVTIRNHFGIGACGAGSSVFTSAMTHLQTQRKMRKTRRDHLTHYELVPWYQRLSWQTWYFCIVVIGRLNRMIGKLKEEMGKWKGLFDEP